MKKEDKEVLDKVVESAEAWDKHQRAFLIEKFGTEEGNKRADDNLAAKVKRWRPFAEGRKTRAQIDAEFIAESKR